MKEGASLEHLLGLKESEGSGRKQRAEATCASLPRWSREEQ